MATDGNRSAPVARLASVAARSVRRLRQGMTLGAQGVVIDEKDRVLLVRHSYRPGWYFPGGGVEWGETLADALVRELAEEVGVRLSGPPVFHGIFSNNANFPGDHIALYLARDWVREGNYRQESEIAETGMFALSDLPAPLDPGTRLRLAEILSGTPVRAKWSD